MSRVAGSVASCDATLYHLIVIAPGLVLAHPIVLLTRAHGVSEDGISGTPIHRFHQVHRRLRFMKKKIACVGLALAWSKCVMAQQSITMYGLIDEFAQYVNTGKGYTGSLSSNGQFASRLGFKGTEDIGGGNQVNFLLENGFTPANGTLAEANTLFNRQAWIGLSGDWGQVRVGQQNSPLFDDQGGQDAFNAGSQASGMNNLSTFDARTSNTVSYISPEFAGFQGGIYVGLGNMGGFRSAGSNYQFNLTYARGPLAAFVAGQWLINAADTTTDHTISAGASYAIGKATLYGGYVASNGMI
jgi:predicted porin